MSKNETLAFRDMVYEIEKRKPVRQHIKALPEDKQTLFTYLCNLSGCELRKALNEWKHEA
jgi:hypothetical protein